MDDDCEASHRSYELTSKRICEAKTDFLVAMRLWDTPVLIPNTMVKT